jgi:alkanesulfonate monooxygenase SsuD/methylene tetrahydromethanopterin reductase-like flavin-dependent oxidoreductase (luciferase family)
MTSVTPSSIGATCHKADSQEAETMETIVRFDMRGPEFGTPLPELYREALAMAEYADAQGVDVILLTEHHGSDDGYCPAPTVLAGGIAARTKSARIRLASVVLPLHNPIAVAEQTLVLDQMSNGRVDLVVAAGYVPSEFAMFGRSLRERAILIDDALPTLAAALAGEPIQFGDHLVTVTPTSVQQPGPPLYVAGGVAAAARRAARYADGFFPMTPDPEIRDLYRTQCLAHGREPGPILSVPMAVFVHVADDPERAWSQIAAHALHDLNSYGRWAVESLDEKLRTPFSPVDDVAAAQACGLYRVVTVDQCVSLMNELEAASQPIVLTPLLAGLAPELAWDSLRLFFDQVLPAYSEQLVPAVT